MKNFEPYIYIALFFILGAGLLSEGARAAALDREAGVTPTSLYRELSKGSSKLQIIDVRPDPEENYEDTHVPGAVPFPGCDMGQTPEIAKKSIEMIIPTIIISEDGDEELFNKCSAHFTSARNLKGGLEAWVEADLPEDSGEYQPPSTGAGGGCL